MKKKSSSVKKTTAKKKNSRKPSKNELSVKTVVQKKKTTGSVLKENAKNKPVKKVLSSGKSGVKKKASVKSNISFAKKTANSRQKKPKKDTSIKKNPLDYLENRSAFLVDEKIPEKKNPDVEEKKSGLDYLDNRNDYILSEKNTGALKEKTPPPKDLTDYLSNAKELQILKDKKFSEKKAGFIPYISKRLQKKNKDERYSKRKKILLTFIVFMFLFALWLFISSSLSVAKYEGKIKVPGLQNKVLVLRDTLGIPVVEAKNEKDLFFTAGYVQAQERLWQMTTLKMLAQGRLSEIAGSEMLAADVFMRALDLKRKAESSYRKLSGKYKQLFISFAKGVNAYIKQKSFLPLEFKLSMYTPEKWKPVDSLYISSLIGFALSVNLQEELFYLSAAARLGSEKSAYLVPNYYDEALPFKQAKKLDAILSNTAFPYTEDFFAVDSTLRNFLDWPKQTYFPVAGLPASNIWAVNKWKSASGKSLLANDTHLPVSYPSFWFIMNLRSHTYKSAGLCIPGIPFVVLGYNGKIAWGATMVEADTQDLYIEKIVNKKDKKYYKYKGMLLPLKKRKEHFKIRFAFDKDIEIFSTVHGPLINEVLNNIQKDDSGKIEFLPKVIASNLHLALKTSLSAADRTAIGMYKMAQAKTMEQARTALSYFDAFYLNIVYADKNQIARQVTGRYPVRKSGRGQLPSPGWKGEYDWVAYRKFTENFHQLNPSAAVLYSANERSMSKAEAYKYSSSWFSPERAQRIKSLLKVKAKADAEYFQKMQSDRVSLPALKTIRLLKMVFNNKALKFVKKFWEKNYHLSPEESNNKLLKLKKVLKLLYGFNGNMDKDSAAAALMGNFFNSFTRLVFLDELGPEDSILWKAFLATNMRSYDAVEDHLLIRKSSPFFDNKKTKAIENKTVILAEALLRARDICAEEMGEDIQDWKWGDFLKIRWKSDFAGDSFWLGLIFNSSSYSQGGSNHTLNVRMFSWGKSESGEFNSEVIPSMRMIIDFGQNEPLSIMGNGGQSGNVSSEHYDSLIEPWKEGLLQPLPLQWNNILRQYKLKLILEP